MSKLYEQTKHRMVKVKFANAPTYDYCLMRIYRNGKRVRLETEVEEGDLIDVRFKLEKWMQPPFPVVRLLPDGTIVSDFDRWKPRPE